jgi:hypothetical protein
MDRLTKEHIQLALRVLSSRYDRTVAITEAEVETLKSYFPGELDGMPIEDIATAVIHRELDGARMLSLAQTA